RVTAVGGSVTFHWASASDRETPTSGLTYNLRVGTTPGGCDILSPLTSANGVRLVAAHGNTGHNCSWTLTNFPSSGPFYWSVQAIDSCFAGSLFAPEQNFTLPLVSDSVRLTSAMISNGVFVFQILGNTGSVYQVYVSSNLQSWVHAGAITNSPDRANEFMDVQATNHPSRFYRLLTP
ncbi:MAG TPA: hypothetical protein VEC99_05630, partial [Clostridia bacterium]|nr:hypothetical protein [Clostridia bacterium]